MCLVSSKCSLSNKPNTELSVFFYLFMGKLEMCYMDAV